MNIKRTLDTKAATYDFIGVTDEEFNLLYAAYMHYANYTRHCPPAEDDCLFNKMKKLMEDRITIV